MNYCGYEIIHEMDHYKVIAPDGTSWTEATVKEAKTEINEELMLRRTN